MNIVEKKLSEITPYENNPRNNDDAVEFVANSIKEFGFKVPIVIDADGQIVCGHARYKAAKKLKMSHVPCVVADDLTPEQIKAFRLADNKTAEFALWDDELLSDELANIFDIDMSEFGFFDDGGEDNAEEEENPYSQEVKVPQYEITGEAPSVNEMLDTAKANSLIEEIESAEGITSEEREFLIQAARRHNVFNYRNIAEYYANATPEMQRLMEKSALVIIDFNDAIANGYVRLSEDIRSIMDEDDA